MLLRKTASMGNTYSDVNNVSIATMAKGINSSSPPVTGVWLLKK